MDRRARRLLLPSDGSNESGTIKSIRIRNFQCHRKLEIQLDPNITTIVGRSDSGKTAILRALRWLVFNRPGGEQFIRKGGRGSTIACVEVGDIHVYRRKCGRKGNVYSLSSGELFSSFGMGVPERIGEILNIGPVSFQRQLDPPFWFLKSPGEVSKELNQIINLEKIDSTLSNIASELRKNRAEVESCEERIAEAQAELSKLAWARKSHRFLCKIERKQKRLDEVRRRAGRLGELVATVREQTGIVNSLSDALPDIDRCMELGKRIEGLKTLIDRMTDCRRDFKRVTSQEKELRKEFQKRYSNGCPLCGNVNFNLGIE